MPLNAASAPPDASLAEYLRTLVRVLPGRTALALILMVVFGLTEGIGLLLLVPLLSLVGLEVQEGTVGRLAAAMSGAFAWVGLQPSLATVLLLFTAIVATQALVYRWQTILNRRIEFEFAAHLRARLYQAILDTSWLHLSKLRISRLAQVLTTEVERVGLATQYLLGATATSIVVLVYLWLAIRLSATTTLLVLACAGVLVIALRRRITRARRKGSAVSEASAAYYHAVLEHLAGMKLVRSYGAEGRTKRLFDQATRELSDRHVDVVLNYAGVRAWFDIGSVAILSATVFVAFTWLGLSTAGVLLLVFAFGRIMPRVSSVQQSAQHFLHALPSFSAVLHVERECRAHRLTTSEPHTPVVPRRSIALDRVSFGYEPPAGTLDDISLRLNVGETVAIVGASGSGKTTLADVLMGLLPPAAGRLLIDDEPVGGAWLAGWREQVGYVAQEAFLFNDTVRANLRWARPGATDSQLEEALRLASADVFVRDLPAGLDTPLGDRGARLSGGERQRLALARALLRRPALLVLDEATSNLDAENERRILQAIEELHGRTTIVLITHRLSLARRADRVYVLDRGRIVESGTGDALLGAGSGRFRALWDAQAE